jgi:hypothetical protein
MLHICVKRLVITANFPAFAKVASSGSSLLSHVSQCEYFEGDAERNRRDWGLNGAKGKGVGARGNETRRPGYSNIRNWFLCFTQRNNFKPHREDDGETTWAYLGDQMTKI